MTKGIVFLLLLMLGGFSAIVLLIPSVMLLLVHSKRVIGWRRRYVSYISGIQNRSVEYAIVLSDETNIIEYGIEKNRVRTVDDFIFFFILCLRDCHSLSLPHL